MSRVTKGLVATGVCAVVGFAVGAGVSTLYWGYPFARPTVLALSDATRVLSVTSISAETKAGRCALQFESLPDLHRHVAGARKYVDEFPYLRALVALQDRGLLPREARAPDWLVPSVLYEAVAQAGVLVRGDPGYDQTGCFGGYAVELAYPSGESRLLLMAGGPEVSNDHHPYYELLLRREGVRLVPERKSVSFYDIAGVEGAEWPLLHAAFTMLGLLVAAAVWGGLLTIATAVQWIGRRRPSGCS